jgi:hypothetical protein
VTGYFDYQFWLENLPAHKLFLLVRVKINHQPFVYKLFRGEGTEQDLAMAGQTGNSADEFYALFYLGLYCEARSETAKAASYMGQAVQTKYATTSSRDYMIACARVHCRLRGWE